MNCHRRILILLIGHGSRRQISNEKFISFSKAFSYHLNSGKISNSKIIIDIKACFLELAKPLLDDVLIQIQGKYQQIILAPILLFSAGHYKKDIATASKIAQTNHPDSQIITLKPIGNNLFLWNSLKSFLLQTCKEQKRVKNVLFIGRGASDSEALRSFFSLKKDLRKTLINESYQINVFHVFCDVNKPSISFVLDKIKSDKKHTLVFPYLLFPGKLNKEIKDLLSNHHFDLNLLLPALSEIPIFLNLLQEQMIKKIKEIG